MPVWRVFLQAKEEFTARTKTTSGDVQEQPFFVIGFVECTVVFKQSRLPQTCVNNIILAKVIPLQKHPQKYFYPKPIEVWNKLEDDLMKILHFTRLYFFHVFCAVVRIVHLSALLQANMTTA